MKQLSVIEQIRVQFHDTDALGIVWHGNYLKYFEIVREAFGRKFNFGYHTAKENGFATPIVKSILEHKLPLHYGELIKIKATYKNNQSAKIRFNYEIYNENDELVCEGETIQVFTNLETKEMSLINPQFYEDWKLKFEI